MLTPLQQRKVARMFQVYDINRDGKLEREDFSAVGHNIAEQRGFPPGSAGYTALAGKYEEFWGRLSTANGGKSSIDLSQYLTLMDAQLGDRAHFEATIHDLGGAAFDVLDSDRDGKVTIEEYRAFLRAHAIDPSLADRAFPVLDLDGDGHISKPEVIQIVKEFYYSDDPAAPGNLFYAVY
jgi:Ca2+-binding EF-hand superfamily protein